MIGSRLAHYEVTAHLGSGGMGDVYQATDAKLGRSVAIKLLPETFTRDADRVARLEREARTLAQVSHPNIASIFGLEVAGSVKFFVMELAAGETLDSRIKRGPIPQAEALAIARQIAEALEAAHEKGIVHRDLKPANIKVSADGHVKVLDFGLAKAFAADGGHTDLTNSPTGIGDTSKGVILGTVAYMSPEQAQGKEVDRRTDIFALGSVLFEMLTGRQTFQGDSAPQILARVIEQDPDWSQLPASTSASVRRLLRRCMQKDRNRRLKSADTVRLEIEDALANPDSGEVIPVVGSRPRSSRTLIAALLLGIAVLAIPAGSHLLEKPAGAPLELRVDIVTPTTSDPASFAISPDGRQIVFVASGNGQQRLWLRRLDRTDAQPLAGTEGASFPFWSPNNLAVGFFDGNKLKRVDIGGGLPRVLADAANRGGTWNSNDDILYARTVSSGIYRIKGDGSTPVPVTKLEKQTSHRFPYFLPDGRHFLYYALGSPESGGLFLGSLDSPEVHRLTLSDSAGIYSMGWVMFIRSGTLVAQELDVEGGAIHGDAVTVADSVSFEASSYGAGISASLTGALAYRAGGATRRQLIWFDRSGNRLGSEGPQDESFLAPNLSPDGKRVVGWRTVQGNADIWLVDASRMTRLTFDPNVDRYALWAKDGSNKIYFDSARRGPRAIFEISSDAPGSETLLLESPLDKVVNDVTSDGSLMVLNIADMQTGWDLWTMPLNGERKPVLLLKTNFEERRAQFSPDGKWVAYMSNESGQQEVYVRPSNGSSAQWQISNRGGYFARWAKDGKELFYLSSDGTLMAAPITVKGSAIDSGAGVPLFHTRIVGGGTDVNLGIQFDVSRDGRFLINTLLDEVGASPITLLQNWNPKRAK